MKPSAPAQAIGTPQAAEVPTAWRISMPRQLRNGTVSEPPPMPINALSRPITPPASKKGDASMPGLFDAFPFWRSRNIWIATRIAPAPTMRWSAGPGSACATNAPATAPAARPGASRANTGQSTPPRRWCASIDDSEVAEITASEVPIATCMTTAGPTPCHASTKASAGTTIRPPPTPNRPASRPAAAPVAA